MCSYLGRASNDLLCGTFPGGRVVKVVLKKTNKGFVLNQQHKQLYLTTLRAKQHIARSREKNIEHNPMPLGWVVSQRKSC